MKEKKLYRFIEFAGALVLIITLLVLIFIDNRFAYVYQSFCKIPNIVFAAVTGMILGGYYLLRKRGILPCKKGTSVHAEEMVSAKLRLKLERRNLILMSVVLFAVQLIVAWQIYFKTGWDCGKLVQMAQEVAFSYRDIGDDLYFSMYPNNVLLVAVFASVLRFTSFLGLNADYFPLVMIGCLLVNLAGFFMSDCIRQMTKKNWIALAAWLIYVVLAGLSPWISIPYSDTYSILFPVFCIWLYQNKTDKNQYLVWGCIGFSSWIGSYIKPTVILTLFVLIALELWHFLCTLEKRKASGQIRHLAVLAAVIFCSVLLAVGVNGLARHKMGWTPDETKKFTPAHYLMMGLNYKTGGTYDQWDVNYSAAASSVKERNAIAFSQAHYRISSMGVKGLSVHFVRKLLTNFNDGTFAWGNEGEFYWNLQEKKNSLSKVLRDYYYEDGSGYPVFQVVTQAAWILVMCLAALLGLKKGRGENQATAAVVLSIMAIGCFVMVFEARARYLFLYAPLFIIAAALGLERFLETAESGQNDGEST